MDREFINAFQQIIKDELKPVNEKLNIMESNLKDFRTEFNNFKNDTTSRLDRIEKRVNATFDQTAGLSEFRTEANDKLDNVNEGIKNIRSDVSLANMTASKNRIDIEMIKNVINK